MLFEALVSRGRSRDASGSLLSLSSGSRKHTLGTAVLVASKVLRSLALLAAYHALHSGLSSSFFASCTLAIASVALLALQRPWVGNSLKGSALLKLAVQSTLLATSFVFWCTGLHLCGPAVTVMLEYIEVILLRLHSMLTASKSGIKGRVGHALRSVIFFVAACLVIVWERGMPSEAPPSSAPVVHDLHGGLDKRDAALRMAVVSGEGWGDGGEGLGGVWGGGDNDSATMELVVDSFKDQTMPFDFAAKSAGEFLWGMCMLLVASAISAARKVQAVGASKSVGGPKRLFAISAPLAAVGLVPFVTYAWLQAKKEGSEAAALPPRSTLLSESQQIPLFAVMGLLVPFYAGNFADKNLPGGDSARVGLLASVVSFVVTWAVRMSPAELSSRVVAITVAFVVMALGDDARDDSVPLGVYSVPGIRGDTTGWMSFVVRGRNFVRQVIADRQSRRIASFLLLNFLFMLVEFIYGILTNSLGLISDSVHMFFDCGALVVGLYGSFMSTWRPNTTYTYGYGRFEVMCGFVNGIFLMVIANFIVLEALERLVDPPPISTDRLLIVSVSGLCVNLVGLFVFSDVGHGHSHGGGGCSGGGHSGGGHSHGRSHGHSHANGKGCSGSVSTPKALEGKRLLDDTGGESKQLGNTLGVVSAWASAVWAFFGGVVRRVFSVESHDANMMGVYLHVLADTLGSAGVIVSSVLVEYKGWVIADPVCSVIIGIFIFVSVIPLVYEAGGTLLQRTPPEVLSILPELRSALLSIEGVVGIECLHIWRQSSKMVVGTVNLHTRGDAKEDHVRGDAVRILQERGVTNVCVQIEVTQKSGGGVRQSVQLELRA